MGARGRGVGAAVLAQVGGPVQRRGAARGQIGFPQLVHAGGDGAGVHDVREGAGQGRQGMRPCVGFRPMVPVKAAGMRIEPPASLPMDRRTTPAATAAAQPPAAAGRERRVPRIAGDAEGWAVGDAFPVEFRRARLAQHGAGIGQPLHEHGMGRRRFGRRERRTAPREPHAANSLMATGMSSGPSAAPWRQRSSDSRAPASAPARSSSAKALMIGSARSACSSALRATSTGETSPRRYSSRRRGQGV